MSPKQRLQQSSHAKEVAAILASPLFELASEAALYTFVSNLPTAPDAAGSMMYHQQLIGALRYRDTLANLMTPAPERQGIQSGTLKPVP